MSINQGRRMPKEKCIENVLAIEMYQACLQLGVPVHLENKGYTRNSTVRRARLRVLLKAPMDEHYVKKSEFDEQTRQIINSEIPNKVCTKKRVG